MPMLTRILSRFGLRSGAVAVVVAAIALLAFAGPADAKGADSVTIEGLGIDEPIELVGSDTATLVKLMEYSGLWYATGDLPLRTNEPSRTLGPVYILSWLVGEVENQRTIRQFLYLDAERGSVIHTPPKQGLAVWGPGVEGWFAAPDGLEDTLTSLGVPGLANSESADLAASTAGLSTVLGYALWAVAIAAGLAVALFAASRDRRTSIRRVASVRRRATRPTPPI